MAIRCGETERHKKNKKNYCSMHVQHTQSPECINVNNRMVRQLRFDIIISISVQKKKKICAKQYLL